LIQNTPDTNYPRQSSWTPQANIS